MRPFYIFLIIFFLASPAFALDVTSLRFGNQGDKQRIVLELSAPAKFKAYEMTGPDRIVIDLPSAGWKIGTIQKPVNSAVKDIRHGAAGNNLTRVVLETEKDTSIASSFFLAGDASHPPRIVLDLTSTGSAPQTAATKTKTDIDKESRPHSAATVQNLAAQLPLPVRDAEPASGASMSRASATKAAENAAMESARHNQKSRAHEAVDIAPEEDYTPPAPSGRNRQKPLIIIDPGHGGQDPGARAANGNFEKSIVLAVGLELKKVLEQSGQYRVQMTRDSDVFIPLKERVKFARRNSGDLFVSLHADSMSNSTVTGASVYTLSDTASDKETEKLAERENKSDAIAGVNLSNQDNDVANILIDLASRDTMNQSRYLANTVVSTMPNNGVSMLARKPHRSAGFAVLKAVDIPSILVEMGYLTNMEEANKLSSREYRTQIARGLKASIDAYFTKVAKLNTP